MAENLGLLCAENTSTFFGDFDCHATDEFGVSPAWHDQNHYQVPFFNKDSCKSLMGFSFSPNSDEKIREMFEREINHLPKDDYLKRLRCGDLDLSSRREALDWIMKAQTHYNFGPLTVSLSINYLDRFLSIYQLPKDKTWTVQLLAVACLSLAAKMDESVVPISVDLQVGEPKFIFEAKTIQRMELLVLSTLKWRMQAITSCSFIDYFLSKINGNQNLPTSSLINRTLQLILSIIKGIDFLEFRPSEIAAAVSIFVSGENQAVDIDKAVSAFMHIEKGRVMKIIELIKDLSLNSSGSASYVPRSPNGVLEAACLSYKSDGITVGSCANSSSHNNSPDSKRKKQANHSTQVENKS